jgi:gliding motility-associated-like protein
MNSMHRSLLSILTLFTLFAALPLSSINAQEQAYIFGDEYLCPDQCGQWFVEFPQNPDLSYHWMIFEGTSPANGTIWNEQVGIGQFTYTLCNSSISLPPGVYTVYLTVSGPGGTNDVATGQTTVFIDGFFDLFGEAYGQHITECEQDTFAISLPGGLEECYEVCVGSTSTLSLDNIIVSDPTGQTGTVDLNQGQWSVTNGTIIPTVNTDNSNFNLAEVYALPGQTVCVPLAVNDFDNILGMQFSINYNAAILQFTGAQNFNGSLIGFTAASIGNPFPGAITIGWNNPFGSGVSLMDNSTILELCFDVVGQTSSSLSFSNPEVIDGNGNEVPFNDNTGAVIIGSPPASTISILWDEEGAGRATFSFWYLSANGCDVFSNIDICFNVIPPPPADFTTQPPVGANGLLEICEGQTVFFTSEATNADAYLWDFGDGGGSSLPNPQHTYNAAGTFEVALITSAGCECADTSRLTVIVEGNDAPFVDCVATICEGTSVTYTANTGCSTYDWTISANGSILDGGGPADDFITIQWGAGPIGEITLQTDGCPDLSNCTEAAYLQVPIISSSTTIEGPAQVCRGDQSVYTVPPFEGTEFTWSVTSFGIIIDGQGTPSVTIEWFDGPIPAGAQTVSVDYSNCYLECGGSAQMDVFIRPEFYLTGEIEVCENSSEDFAVVNTQTNVGFPASFSVIASDGTTVWTSPGAGSTFPINWNFGPGDFTLVATPQNPADFCTLQAEMAVKVIAQPAAVATINGQTEICAGIAYTYSIANPVNGERYRWTINNGGTITEREGASIAVIWNAGGPYALSVIRRSPPLFCSSAATSLNIGAVGSFAISGDDQVCVDQLAAYTSDQTGDVFYDWAIQPASAGTITGDPTAADIEVLWHSAGPATVTLDICGQQETFVVNVNAPPQPVVNHPATICEGILASVSTTVAYATYSWQDAEGVELSTSATPDLAGGYYRVDVTDANGCVGRTIFHIYQYPTASINISTPDFTRFCNVPPFSRLYAANTADGYDYQWFQNGSAIPGATNSDYTATAFGNYHVEIIDESGCAYASNVITLQEDCGSIGGTGGGAGCNNPDHTFTTTDNGSCDNRAYSAIATGAIPGSIFWIFDDPFNGTSGGNGQNVTYQYTKPGFYRVLMAALYDDGMGGSVLCREIIPDTIFAVANFAYDGVCPGVPVQFYDLTTFLDLTSITSWSWDFGDPASGVDNSSSDQDPVHIFTAGGDFPVTLTVTTDQGCTTTITKTVSLYPFPYTNFPEPDVSCALTSIAFNADVAATVWEVNWNFGEASSDDANTSTLFDSYHRFATSGNFLVTLDATSVYGCVNSFDRTIAIIPNTLSGEIDPPGNSTLCEGDELTLNAPGNGATSWLWSTSEDTQAIIVDEAAAYSVVLTDDDGCTYKPQPVLVDIIPAPQSPIRSVTYNDFNQPTAFTYDTLFVCFGEDIFLETENTAGYTYQWSNGDTGTDTEYTEDRGNLLAAGEYLVTMDVTDTSTGCSATEVFVIVVRPTPNIPVLDSGNGALCAGTAATISVSNPQANVIYFWSSGDVGPSITTDEAGEYYVTSVNIYGCRNESEVTEVLEGPDISLVPNGCHTRCAPDTLCLPAIPNVISYQWYLDGVLIPAPDGTIPNLIVDQSGSYTLEMEDNSGCVQTSNPLNIDLLPGFGTFLGNIYYDLNNNEMIDAADSLAGGIEVELAGNMGLQDAITTPLNGAYGFVNVPEDDYTLSINAMTVPASWSPQIASIDTTFMGCDQEVVINWLLVQDCDFDTTFIASICPGEDYIFQGQPYAIGSNNMIQVTSAQGCDSTFNFTVTALPSSTEILGVEICAGETYSYFGTEYPIGTDELITFTNSAGCDSIVQLQIVASPEASFALSTEESCLGIPTGSLIVAPNSGAAPFVYAIDDGDFQTQAAFTDLEAGAYDLTVEDANGCQYIESFTVDASENLVVNVTDVMLPCDSAAIQLQPEIISGDDGFLFFQWSDGITTQNRQVSNAGTLQLEVSNGCETISLPVTVTAEKSPEGSLIYVPNAFSPNNDGANDAFKVYPGQDVMIDDLDFQIFDRWGSLIFDAQSGTDEWDGVNNGRRAAQGVYIWQLKAKVNLCGQAVDVVQQGEVILVR